MAAPQKATVRIHARSTKTRSADAKGERFYCQGNRWRFPRGLGAMEVETRKTRIRQLWDDQEEFCLSAVFLDLDAVNLHEAALTELVHFARHSGPAAGSSESTDLTSHGDPPVDHQSGTSRAWLSHQVSRYCGKNGLIPRAAAWSPLSDWIAEQIRLGKQPINLPPWNALISSVSFDQKLDYRFLFLANVLRHPPEAQPERTEQLDWNTAFLLLQSLTTTFPSVPWTMYDHQVQMAADFHLGNANSSLTVVSKIKPEDPAANDFHERVKGFFHESVRAYRIKREADFTNGDSFDGSGHHMLGLLDNFLNRQPDVALAKLDFSGCQQIYDFWRNRPPNLRDGKPLSSKHCSGHIGELDRFFRWLHTTSEFDWRRPADFDLIDRRVKRLDSDRRSVREIELKTFSFEQLTLLSRHATTFEKLLLFWCLNCSHGAAEMGRVEWGDLYLRQPHPWVKDGLTLTSTPTDSWCGFLRPKTNVIGWWWLWPETVRLIDWWRRQLEGNLKREVKPEDRLLLTKTGTPFYRDSSRNAQTSFANLWARLLNRTLAAEGPHAIPRLPFGTLRDQMSNWLGSDQNQAVLASTALAHGIPHKGDKLLFGRYSNRPWSQLFEKQKEFREVLKPMLDAISD